MAIHELKSKLNIETFNQEMIIVNKNLDNKVDKGTVMTHEDFLDNENITIPDNDIINRLNIVESNSNLLQRELEKKADKNGIITSEPFINNDTFEFEEDVIVRLNKIEQNMVTSLDI